MKKINQFINKWEDRMEEKWNGFSRKKQNHTVIIALIIYILITIGVIASTWLSGEKQYSIRHIKNPIENQNNK